MSEAAAADVTRLLDEWSGGDAEARDRLLPLVYDELRRLAHRHLRGERHAETLNTTALVHEAYLKLVRRDRTTWRSRAYFFALASRAMRQILVDHARARGSVRRGSGAVPLPLDDALAVAEERGADFVALDEALTRLAAHDPQMAQVVEYRFFGGLTAEETAEVLGVTPATVRREWDLARAWLYQAMREP
ncbi:MAG TPA: sigma-70 family RNA polymerase sigma factor [Rhodothermales bacterium]|nr:sigma-70 family RNA polymerase sigma factor [Rhodothermales bacterium]